LDFDLKPQKPAGAYSFIVLPSNRCHELNRAYANQTGHRRITIVGTLDCRHRFAAMVEFGKEYERDAMICHHLTRADVHSSLMLRRKSRWPVGLCGMCRH